MQEWEGRCDKIQLSTMRMCAGVFEVMNSRVEVAVLYAERAIPQRMGGGVLGRGDGAMPSHMSTRRHQKRCSRRTH